jgi:hypothetical protein
MELVILIGITIVLKKKNDYYYIWRRSIKGKGQKNLNFGGGMAIIVSCNS